MQFEYEPERLIEEVKIRSGLWDYNHPDNRDKITRTRLWNEVVHALLPNLDDLKLTKSEMQELVIQIQKKWKGIRDAFLKYLNNPKRSRKPYIYYKYLLFLKGDENKDTTHKADSNGEPPKKKVKAFKKVKLSKASSTSEEEAEVEYLEQFSDDDNEYSCNDVKSQIKNNNFNADHSSFNPEFAFANVSQSSAFDPEEEADRLFLLSLLPHLRTVPKQNKLKVRMEMLQVLQNANYIEFQTAP